MIHEEDWDTEIRLADDFSVHILPSQHFSGRFLDRNPTQWCGWQEPYRELARFSEGRGYKLLTPEIGEAAYLDDAISKNFEEWWEKMK